jgi:hypothetical protein
VTTRTLTLLLLGLVLVACEPDKRIGENDPDASLLTGGDATDATTNTCACGPASCGSRICGRSDCGYPCGECEPGEYCFAGNSCNAGAGPGTPCVDAFGDRVWEGDRGFRACATNPDAQQRCTCTGGGADAWASCDPTCVEICTHVSAGITCGAPACGSGEVCCIPTANTNTRTCTAGSCPVGSYTRACDGPEDCMTGESCCGADYPWTARCTPAGSCTSLDQFCHTGNDCDASQPFCCPGPIEDMRRCSATDAPTCT